MSGVITIGNNTNNPSIPVNGVITIGNNTSCGGERSPVFHEHLFISFPLIGITLNTTFLKIDVASMSSNIDFTNNLPSNLPTGCRLVIRKLDSSLFKIIYNDGLENYTFVNKKSEYIELYYNGLSWII